MGRSVVVLGASGYSGGEVLRLLAHHPALEVAATGASRRAGEPLQVIHPHLAGLGLPDPASAAEALAADADLVVSCMPAGALDEHLTTIADRSVVDLADTYRASAEWTYGLPEYNRTAATTAGIANPGCYPTAALLCLLPFAETRAIGGPVVIDAMSGVSGAGRDPSDRLLFGSIADSVGAYGDVTHRHVAEIERYLERFGGLATKVSFTPHLVPMSRGVLVTARSPLTRELDDGDALEILNERYSTERFVHVLEDWPSTKPVMGSNLAHVSARVDPRTGYLICSAAIDNLGKGAAGQAIQNVNLLAGLEESLGLEGIGIWP